MSDLDFAASGVSTWAGGATIGDSDASVGTVSVGRGAVSGVTALGGEDSGIDFVRPLGSRFSDSSALG